MDNFLTKLRNVLRQEKNTQLLRKSFLYYLLVFFIVCSGIDLRMIHFLRRNYLSFLYRSLPATRDFGVGVIFYDYHRRLNPNDPDVWDGLAKSYSVVNDFPGVIETYLQAIRVQPDRREYYLGLAEAYRQIHQDKKAEEVLNSCPRGLP